MNLAKTVRTLARFFPTTEDGQAETPCAPKRITLGVHGGMRPSYLAFADVLIVTGESESMLAEAAATHKPVYIYPLPERPGNVKSQLKEWIVACAQRPQRNARGVFRPRRGLAYQCARLVERGVIRPRRDLNLLHQTLVKGGFAHFFGEPFTADPRPALQESDRVA